MRTLWIHVGHAKTGTRSIQATAAASRAALLAEGLAYPGDARDHRDVVPALKAGKTSALAPFLEAAGAGDVLMSSEFLGQLDLARRRTLVDGARAAFDAVRIVVFVRHPVGYATSAAAQAIKANHRTYAEVCRAPRVWPAKREIEGWVRAAGRERVVVRRYRRDEDPAADVVADFFHAIGFARLVPALARASGNPAPSLDAALLRSELNARPPGERGEEADREAIAALPGARFALPAWSAGLVMEAVAPELDYLERAWGISFDRAAALPPGTELARRYGLGSARGSARRRAGPSLPSVARPGVLAFWRRLARKGASEETSR